MIYQRIFVWFGTLLAVSVIGVVVFLQFDRSEPLDNEWPILGQMYWVPKDSQDAPSSIIERGVGVTLHGSELIFVQVPWAMGFDSLEAASWLSQLAKKHNKKLGIGLDWMNSDRTDLLKAGAETWQFSEEKAYSAFEKDSWMIAKTYNPDYLSLGIEVDFLARNSPREFQAFVNSYQRIYQRIKSEFPAIKVLVTFQYDAILRDSTEDQLLAEYGAIKAFGALIDIVGLSVYPCQQYAHVAEIRSDYFRKANQLTRNVGVFETAWPGSVVEQDEQRKYVHWLLKEARRSAFDVLIWTSSTDIAAPISKQERKHSVACGGNVADWNGHLGLWDMNGKMKPAGLVWKDQLTRKRIISGSGGEATSVQTHQSSKPGY